MIFKRVTRSHARFGKAALGCIISPAATATWSCHDASGCDILFWYVTFHKRSIQLGADGIMSPFYSSCCNEHGPCGIAGARALLATGGRGGRGNASFKTGRNKCVPLLFYSFGQSACYVAS